MNKHDDVPDTPPPRSNSGSAARSPTDRIRDLNDGFRRTLQGGKVFVTAGVAALGAERVQAILRRVTEFDCFTPDNDPHGEHDFGNFEEGR
jgi:hypothetical protein